MRGHLGRLAWKSLGAMESWEDGAHSCLIWGSAHFAAFLPTQGPCTLSAGALSLAISAQGVVKERALNVC